MVKGYIVIDQKACKGCELCISFCPKASICLTNKQNPSGYIPAEYKEGSECTGCAICAQVCPEVAIEVYRD